MRVWYLPDFWEDVQLACEWYEERRLGLGAEFVAAIDLALTKIIERPQAYRIATRETRRCIIARFQHILFFETTDQTLLVLGVVHGSRETRRWLKDRRR